MGLIRILRLLLPDYAPVQPISYRFPSKTTGDQRDWSRLLYIGKEVNSILGTGQMCIILVSITKPSPTTLTKAEDAWERLQKVFGLHTRIYALSSKQGLYPKRSLR